MTVNEVLERMLHLVAATIIEEEEQVPKTVDIRNDDPNKPLVETVYGLFQNLSGATDGNSRESGGI